MEIAALARVTPILTGQLLADVKLAKLPSVSASEEPSILPLVINVLVHQTGLEPLATLAV